MIENVYRLKIEYIRSVQDSSRSLRDVKIHNKKNDMSRDYDGTIAPK